MNGAGALVGVLPAAVARMRVFPAMTLLHLGAGLGNSITV